MDFGSDIFFYISYLCATSPNVKDQMSSNSTCLISKTRTKEISGGSSHKSINLDICISIVIINQNAMFGLC